MSASVGPPSSIVTVFSIVTLSPTARSAEKVVGSMLSAHVGLAAQNSAITGAAVIYLENNVSLRTLVKYRNKRRIHERGGRVNHS